MKRIYGTLTVLWLVGLASFAVAGTSPGNPEAELDQFLTEYTRRLKAAVAVKDDTRMLAMLQQMKADFCPWADRLRPKMQSWEKSMTPQQKLDWEARMEKKPYVQDLLKIGFNAEYMQRLNKNPKLKEVIKEIDACINKVGPKEQPAEEENSEEDEPGNN